MNETLETLQRWIDESRCTVFFRRRRRVHRIGNP